MLPCSFLRSCRNFSLLNLHQTVSVLFAPENVVSRHNIQSPHQWHGKEDGVLPIPLFFVLDLKLVQHGPCVVDWTFKVYRIESANLPSRNHLANCHRDGGFISGSGQSVL